MAISIKSAREIELMRESGRILAKVHDELCKAIVPGISTKEIDIIGQINKKLWMYSEFFTLQWISGKCVCVGK